MDTHTQLFADHALVCGFFGLLLFGRLLRRRRVVLRQLEAIAVHQVLELEAQLLVACLAVFADLGLQVDALLVQLAQNRQLDLGRADLVHLGVLLFCVIRLDNPAVEQHQAHRQEEQYENDRDQRTAADQLAQTGNRFDRGHEVQTVGNRHNDQAGGHNRFGADRYRPYCGFLFIPL